MLGVAYRRPNDAKWFVRCGDEQECGTRVADIKAAERGRRHERHLASDQHAEHVEIAARYDVPKTLSIELDGYTHKITRRKTSRGVSVTQTHISDDDVVDGNDPTSFPTEADAVAYIVDQLSDCRWLDPCEQVRATYKSVLEALRVDGA